VVLDYVIGSAERLQNYLDQLPDEPIGLVVLTPSIEVARARDRERPDEAVLQAWAHMHEEMVRELAGPGTLAGHQPHVGRHHRQHDPQLAGGGRRQLSG
jgi:hypothetical protein